MIVLEDLYFCVAQGWTDKAIDAVFTVFDMLLSNGDINSCNNILRDLDVTELDTNLIVAVLSITLPAAALLEERKYFFSRAYERLSQLAPERVDALLEGLEDR